MGSACLNPVSYAFFNHNFRQQFVMFHDAAIRKILQAFELVTSICYKRDRVKYSRPKSAAMTLQHAREVTTINAQFTDREDEAMNRTTEYLT
ncbi:unnamed protein product [Gongylonema pulchrum]|uniref:G_PROTEIN_RECEP_F1_2 domain-containing protein n=1 Tax=Gongylonema pulchrum TaxID=637853 RepID=A0A183EF55_9BILA|nr:unnamed protein product [Gongylonema pulchrum]